MITLAIVGRGHWGTIYAKTISVMSGVVLPEKYTCGRDYAEILTSEISKKVDGVIIASPAVTHFGVTKTLLKNGYKNILIEKPVTHDLKTAHKLLELEKYHPDAHLMAAHVQLYDPGYNQLKKFIKKNRASIQRIKYLGLKSPHTGPSIIKEWGPHPIYLFLDLLGKMPKKVSTREVEYDNIELTMEFDNGVVAVAHIGTIYHERRRQLITQTDKGIFVLNEFLNPRNLYFFNKKHEEQELVFSNETALEMQLREFIKCIKTKKHPRSSIANGVEVVKIIALAEKSLKN